MVSTDNGEENGTIQESTDDKSRNHFGLNISTSQRGLISDKDPPDGLLDKFSNRLKLFRVGNLSSPSVKFYQIAQERDEISRNVPSSSLHIRERVHRLFSRKINWPSVWNMSREWLRDPMNLALLVWIVCVAVSGAILFLVMTGMLNHALPKKSTRDAWFEVNNQILNALFTLMCLYQQPKRIHHLVLLLRWRSEDIAKLREIYCKNGTYKPHEWTHMLVVIILLHINCFAQYALCGLNLGYKRSQRPAIGVGITVALAIGAPAAAGLYSILSPLGRDYESELDEESQLRSSAPESSVPARLRRQSLEKRLSFASFSDDGRILVTRPEWRGGIFDFWDDISLAYLSLFCSFCVFGWNMERLGFGNMYVHIATFLLFCMAPFWIFNLAAININNETVREALGVTGIFLCVFGLLYGGFWRYQMRKRFNLPPYNFCFSKPALADFSAWLFCCWCSLAQEVRTGNAYDVVEDKLYIKQTDEYQPNPISPLPREEGQFMFRSSPSPPGRTSSPSHLALANSPSPPRFPGQHSSPGGHLPSLEEEGSFTIPKNEKGSSASHVLRASSPSPSRFAREYTGPSKDMTMLPPVPSSISRGGSI